MHYSHLQNTFNQVKRELLTFFPASMSKKYTKFHYNYTGSFHCIAQSICIVVEHHQRKIFPETVGIMATDKIYSLLASLQLCLSQ